MVAKKIPWTVRVSEEINERAEALAKKNKVSKSTLVVEAVKEMLKKQEAAK